jgi:ParB family chromosome partitioning protein
MKQTAETIPLTEIDLNDSEFLLSFGYDRRPLKQSLDRAGLINPPVVRKKPEGGFQIICGYKRIEALAGLSASSFSCRILPPGTDDMECLLLNLYDNLSHRLFNPIEKSMAIQRLEKFFTEEKIITDFLPLLKVNPHKSQLELLKPLCTLERSTKDAVVTGVIDVHTARKLAQMDSEDREVLSSLLSTLRLSVSKQAALIEYVSEIALREHLSREEVAGSSRIQSVIEDEHLNLPQKADFILRYLRERRYPQLTAKENTFKQHCKEFNLPSDVQFTPPPHFEGNRYCLTLHFVSLQQLREQLSGLESFLDDPSLISLIEG